MLPFLRLWWATSAAITQVSYSSVQANATEGFSGFSGLASPYVDSTLGVSGMTVGKRFAGQQNGVNPVLFNFFIADSNFETLIGSPTGPLALEVGTPGRNLYVGADSASSLPSQGRMLSSVGPGNPTYGGTGVAEGTLAFLFDVDQSALAFKILAQQVWGGNNGADRTIMTFYRRDGSLIDTITLVSTDTLVMPLGFSRDGGIADIAGMTISTTDINGIAVDDFRYTSNVPTPGAIALLGLAGLAKRRRR